MDENFLFFSLCAFSLDENLLFTATKKENKNSLCSKRKAPQISEKAHLQLFFCYPSLEFAY